MKKESILIVDDDVEFARTRARFLERRGYQVFAAHSPQEGNEILQGNKIDLILIDVRLVDNSDEKDISGIRFARAADPEIPKIMLTAFPSVEGVRSSLAIALEGLPPAVDFIPKEDGEEAMLTAIRRALTVASRFLDSINELSGRIERNYDDSRQQARFYFWISLGMSILGILAIFIGIGLAFSATSGLGIGLVSSATGLVIEGSAFLIFKRSDQANARMDRYHKELLLAKQFDNLLSACDELPGLKQRRICKRKVIMSVTGSWFTPVEEIEI